MQREDRRHSQEDHHPAHHISEFGAVEDLVHIEAQARPSHEDEQPVPPVTHRDPLATKERFFRLRRRLFHERHIHQYWQGETLFRTAGNRSIGPDELFLDLVIVGGIAALGHELRETFSGWRDVEKFLVLFGALIVSWRSVVFLWNLWGVSSDLIDKFGIYLIFTCLTFISLGAHGAFDDGVRPYVAVAAFLASAIPTTTALIWGLREPLLKTKQGPSSLTVTCVSSLIGASPYLAAAFVDSDRVSRILFWVALGAHLSTFFSSGYITKLLAPNTEKQTRVAVSIELFVEKYEVLTMIVLGESVLGILFEGALVVTKEGVRLRHLFGSAAIATAMLYSLQTLYNNVDSPISRGGKHAIRYKKNHGLVWSVLHVPYHAALVLFATGLGIAIRDIAIKPKTSTAEEAVAHVIDVVIREADSGHKRGFDYKARWLFSAGWGASLILSGLIGSCHLAGPRAATKRWRLVIRSLIAIALMFGMPFADVSAEIFLHVFGTVLVLIALSEYILVQMDNMGFFRSENTVFSSSADALEKEMVTFGDERDSDDSDEFRDSDDKTDVEKLGSETIRRQTTRGGLEEQMAEIELPEDVLDEQAKLRLRQRMCRSHRMRLVPASQRKCKALKNNSIGIS